MSPMLTSVASSFSPEVQKLQNTAKVIAHLTEDPKVIQAAKDFNDSLRKLGDDFEYLFRESLKQKIQPHPCTLS